MSGRASDINTQLCESIVASRNGLRCPTTPIAYVEGDRPASDLESLLPVFASISPVEAADAIL